MKCLKFLILVLGGEQIIAKGEFTSNDVHKQYGISFRTPAYINKEIGGPVKCSMFLYKPKSKASSEPVDFWFAPKNQVGYMSRSSNRVA